MKNSFLKGITWDHIRGYDPLESSVKPFEEMTGIRITWEKRSLKDFGNKPLDTLACDYDLIIMDHPHSGAASELQCVIPFNKYLDKTTLDELSINSTGPSFKSYHYNGDQWALPIDAACQVSVYRSDLLSPELLPQKWDDVFRLAADLRKNSYIGIALCPTDCCCVFLTLCAQCGDGPAENKRYFVSDKTAFYALQIIRRLFEISHPHSAAWDPIQLQQYMSNENNIVYAPLVFGYNNYGRKGFANHRLRFDSIPGKTNALLGGAGIAVSMRCKKIEAAVRYSAWVCGKNFQKREYVESGGQPAHKCSWTDKKNNALTNDFFFDTLNTIEHAFVRPRSPNWLIFQEEIGYLIHEYLSNRQSEKRTWQLIQKLYDSYSLKRL